MIHGGQIDAIESVPSSQTAKDHFFTVLESNLDKYANDRNAAYNFIINQLKVYDGKFKLDFLTSISYLTNIYSIIRQLHPEKEQRWSQGSTPGKWSP